MTTNTAESTEDEDWEQVIPAEKYAVMVGINGRLGAELKVAPTENESGVAVVEHTLSPGALGAPPHRHTREDEISYVLEGTLTVQQDDEITAVGPSEFAIKPRGVWHTFWNAGFERVRFLEIITPGAFAGYFEELAGMLPAEGMPDEEDEKRNAVLDEKYGLETNPAAIRELIEQHGFTE